MVNYFRQTCLPCFYITFGLIVNTFTQEIMFQPVCLAKNNIFSFTVVTNGLTAYMPLVIKYIVAL